MGPIGLGHIDAIIIGGLLDVGKGQFAGSKQMIKLRNELMLPPPDK